MNMGRDLDLFGGEHNLSFTERAVSVVAGLGLAAIAAKPRPNKLLSLGALVAGSMLAIRGATGHCSVKAMITDDHHPQLAGR